MKRLHCCNILQTLADSRHLWQFGFNDGKAIQTGENLGALGAPLPSSWVAKDLRNLWQRRVNLAWFPPENVFLRVIQLPAGEPSELPAMVELQLEKLSPLPVTQIVWTAEALKGTVEGMQTVVVVIAARAQVEEYLGKLDANGFLADRLEIPVLHQLAELTAEGEGLWLFPEGASGAHQCLAAWWSGGILRNLTLLRVATGETWGALLIQQLTQMAWAGQMEGWLAQIPKCKLVTDEATALRWSALLRDWAAAVEVVPVKTAAELAALNASRLARDEAKINLVPPEHAGRFRQQFIDRIWMGGLFAVMGVYVVGVLIYFAALEVLNFQKGRLDQSVANITPQYTNSIRLRERVAVLQDQVNLKFAALECWKAACVLLPADLTLTGLQLNQGQTLALNGTAKVSDEDQIFVYTEALSKYQDGTNGHRLFKSVTAPSSRDSVVGGQKEKIWNFSCELNRTDAD
jgi:hypothetical protein